MNSKTHKSGKVVVVGDGACGKTCLLEVFRRNQFPETYIPTVVDNFVKEVKIADDKYVSLALWDTAGQEDYDTIRPLSYKETDLVLLCYTIENKKKIPNISRKWLMEIKNYCPTSQFFLVGLKKDMRDMDDPTIDKSSMVTEDEGKKIADNISATRFFECSSRTRENVNLVFLEAAKHIWDTKQAVSESGPCSLFSCMSCCRYG
ncbi:Rho GTPase [Encephalitozoon hellem ATCC 50504]|uniref:Rho-related GTP-binding protein n=1 Tax=Encephalitozoon hellem TaxID=27973 RepID=A0A9Q9C5I2_ENCHE|nr:Rho GTPase [Encephalitozoon hellem ATCC 50504]AFM99130.1 Rho GTPase [Encephalitozoon hellem ATCC 50504]UTX44115.1 transforming protein RhoA [Encephalitozoon hellem]WEL39604.1 Rho-related GTP-binding protein [Encephalitozoon hellem]|eukprot:XP_003888111.1 Rho GTPase [Encephalitozoon hellem ATCC 50504]